MRDELEQICEDYLDHWHVQEFFNAYQAMGWNRAGSLNLQIRYAHLSMALIAQAVVHQFRQRLGDPYDKWEADHLGNMFFKAFTATCASPNIRKHYEGLPRKLKSENWTRECLV